MVDPEVYTKVGAAGLLCTWAEERFGGAGIDDYRFEQIIIEENMRHGDICTWPRLRLLSHQVRTLWC